MTNLFQEIVDTTEDSDSDVEDIRNVVEKSQSQLTLAENLFARANNGTMPDDCVRMIIEMFFPWCLVMRKLYSLFKVWLRSVNKFASILYRKIVSTGVNIVRMCERMKYFFFSLASLPRGCKKSD